MSEEEVVLVDEVVKCAKESNDVQRALTKVNVAIADAIVDDGKFTKEEILGVVTAPIQELLEAVQGAEKIVTEHEKDLPHAANAWWLVGVRASETYLRLVGLKERLAQPKAEEVKEPQA